MSLSAIIYDDEKQGVGKKNEKLHSSSAFADKNLSDMLLVGVPAADGLCVGQGLF